MNQLTEFFIERIASGLQRKSITRPSFWAETYRILGGTRPGPWRFDYFPWLREMHDSEAELNVGKKAAQMGFTETVLNITFFNIDVNGYDCLYVLPNKTPDASDFSAARFDPALELSIHLSKLFSDVKNVGHKRAGSANLYIRGSQSRAGLKSIPVSFIVLDEIEEFNQEAIPLALERTSGQAQKQVWMISTPSIDDYGIDAQYKKTTQEHFFFKCPRCNHSTELTFPECLVITTDDLNDPSIVNSYLQCKECKGKLEHEDKRNFLKHSEWVPQHANRLSRGFYINQLYSSSVKPYEVAISYLKSLTNPADEQEFYNSKLGKTHAVKGARLTDQDIDTCKGYYKNGEYQNPIQIVTIGIDVGSWLNYEITAWQVPEKLLGPDINIESKAIVLQFGKVQHFEEIDRLIIQYQPHAVVIDANPERRKAYDLANRFYGRVKLCFYGRGINGKQINVGSNNPDAINPEHTITVDRTSWLDLSLGRFRNQTITTPYNIDLEYREQLKAPVKVYERDKDGNPIGKYVEGSKADHYAHARNYSEIALPFAINYGTSYDLTNV